MANVLWAESFDHYGLGTSATIRNRMTAGLWADLSTNYGTSTSVPPRTGLYACRASGSGLSEMRRIVGEGATRGCAFGFYVEALPTANNLANFSFRTSANGSIVTLCFQSNGAIDLKLGGRTGTVLATSSNNFVAGSWEHIEISCTVSTTVGQVEVRLNGEAVIFVDALNLGSEPTGMLAWSTGGTSTSLYYIDDVVAHDGVDFIGQARVLTVYPQSDGTPFDWAVTGAASGHDAVNDVVPDDDTTFIEAAVVNDVATFGLPALPADVGGIVGVFMPFMSRQAAAGESSVRASIISGGNVQVGDNQPATEAWTYLGQAFNSDPNTLGNWTKTALESAQLRFERTV